MCKQLRMYIILPSLLILMRRPFCEINKFSTLSSESHSNTEEAKENIAVNVGILWSVRDTTRVLFGLECYQLSGIRQLKSSCRDSVSGEKRVASHYLGFLHQCREMLDIYWTHVVRDTVRIRLVFERAGID